MATGTLCLVCKVTPPEDQVSVAFWLPGNSVSLYRRRLGAVLELELSEDDLNGQCLCVPCESRLNKLEKLRRMQDVFKQQFLTSEPLVTAGHWAEPDEAVPQPDNAQELSQVLHTSPKTETGAPTGATGRDTVDATRMETYCGVCNTTLATPRGLRLHQRIHEDVTTRLCKVCGSAFTSASALQLHVQQEHGALRLYQCQVCAFTSTSPASMRTHTRRKHPGQNADFTYLLSDIPEWPESLAAVARLQRQSLPTLYRRSNRKQKYNCLKCTSTFADIATLKEHMVSHHRLPAAGTSDNKERHKPGISVVERDKESEIDANPSEGAVNIKQDLPMYVNNKVCCADPSDDTHSNKDDDSESSMPEDSEVFNHLHKHGPNQDNMVQGVKESSLVSDETIDHLPKGEPDKSVGSPGDNVCKMNHSPRVSGRKIALDGNSDVGKNSRRDQHQGSACCPHCTRTFRREAELADHIRDHTEGKVLQCVVCQMGFKQQVSLHNHMLKHTGLYPHRCPDCGKGFAQAWALRNHAAVHSKATPYPCRHCSVRFMTLHQRRMHCRRQHPQKQQEAMKDIEKKDMTFSCQTCDKTFRRKLNLTAHLETHNTTKTAECQLCLKKFKGKSQLASHMHWHSLESKKVKGQKFLCEECGKSYKNMKGLRDHIRCHRGDRTFTCPVCQLVVPNQSRLQKHIETVHSPAKPYKCDLCEKSFVYKISYDAHCNMHKDLRPFLCSTCGKGFRTRPHLKEHMNVHSQTKSFLCNQCSLSFMWRAQLIRHKNQAHADPSIPKAPTVKRGPRKKPANHCQAPEPCLSSAPLETVNPTALDHGATVGALEHGVTVGTLEHGVTMGTLEAAVRISPLESAVRVSPLEPTVKVDPLEPAVIVSPLEPAVRVSPLEPALKVDPLEPAVRVSPLEPAVRVSPLEPALRVSPLESALRGSPLEPSLMVRPLEHALVVRPEAEAAEPPPAVPPLAERVAADSHVMLPPDTGTFLQLNGSMVRGQLLQNMPIQAFLQQSGTAGRTTYVIRPSHMGLVAEVLPEGHPLQQQQQGPQQQQQQQGQHQQAQQQQPLQQELQQQPFQAQHQQQ